MTEAKKKIRLEQEITPTPNTLPLPAIVQRGALIDFFDTKSLSNYSQSSEFNQRVAEKELKTRLTSAEEGTMIELQNILVLLSPDERVDYRLRFIPLVEEYLVLLFKFNWNRRKMLKSLLSVGTTYLDEVGWIFSSILASDIFRTKADIQDWQEILIFVSQNVPSIQDEHLSIFLVDFSRANFSKLVQSQFLFENFNLFSKLWLYTADDDDWELLRNVAEPLSYEDKEKLNEILKMNRTRIQTKLLEKLASKTDFINTKELLKELWSNESNYF